MKNKQLLTTIAIAIACLGIGYWVGTKHKTAQEPAFVNQFSQRNRNQSAQGGSRAMGGAQTGQFGGGMSRPVIGEVTSSDSKSVTVKMSDGSSKIVLLSSTTQVNKAQTADISELKVGEQVSVFGQTNPDGSVTAQNIQLNPMARTATPSATPAK